MAAINGTNVLLYSNGKAIAVQKGLSFGLNDSVIDTSNKESLGWFECISGMKDAQINFSSLFATGVMTDTPAILGAKNLLNYIINSSTILVAILGGGCPLVGKANMSSLAFDAPAEGAMGLTGSLKVSGPLYPLSGTYAALITGWTNDTFETFTNSGTTITSAIETGVSGSAYSTPNFNVTTGEVFKVITFLTKNSGALPAIRLDSGAGTLSNVVTCVEGLNYATLTATGDSANGKLFFTNAAAANWLTSPIYIFKT